MSEFDIHRSTTSTLVASTVVLLLSAVPTTAATESKNVNLLGQVGGTTFGIAANSTHVYFGIGPRLAVADVGSPTSSTPLGLSEPLPGWVAGVALAGSHAYVAAADAGLRILDVSAPSLPVEVGFLDFRGDAVSVAVSGDYALVVDGLLGLRVIDVSDPANPVLLSSVETEGAPNHVVASGDFAFVSDGFAGVRIIDLSNPASPFEAAYFETPGFTEFVHLADGIAYVADKFSGLRIVDVSDPVNPVGLGLFDTPGFGLGVTVLDDHAYVADGSEGIRVINVSDPTNPFEVGDFPTPGGAALTSATVAAGGFIYVADGDRGMRVLDVSEPSLPFQLAHVEGPAFVQSVASGISGVLVLANDTAGLWTVDASTPTQISILGKIDSGAALDVVTVGDHAFVADGFAGLRIYDISDAAAPTEVGAWDTPGFSTALSVADGVAYVADSDSGIVIVDISQIDDPQLLGIFQTPAAATCIDVAGGFAYVCAGEEGLRILDVSDPANAVEVGVFPTPGSFTAGVQLDSGRAYLLNPDLGLTVIDIANPANPVEIGNVPLVGFAFNIDVDGQYAYIAAGVLGLRIVDISDPAAIREVAFFDTPVNAWNVKVQGDLVYVADQGGGLYILDFDESAVGEPVGGTSFGIMLNPNPQLSWIGGTAQTAYVMVRVGNDSETAENLPPGGLLQASTTLYSDDEILTESSYCYWLLALDENGVVGKSDYFCATLNSRTGTVIPEQFTLRLNQSEFASMEWIEPGGQDAYVLVAMPMEGSDNRILFVDADETQIVDDTKSVPTCYILLAIRGVDFGTTDMLCAIPGASE